MQKILLIGSGRWAQHLTAWNSQLDLPNFLSNWNRKQSSIESLKDLIEKADLVWLALSDSAIVPFFEHHLQTAQSKRVVHFSGALHDPRLACAHPLMSFPAGKMDEQVYSKIHFAVTGADDLQSLLPGFTNSFSLLKPEDKALYHALCVVTGNFPQLLWSETFPQFQKLGLPVAAIETYVQQITTNFILLKENAVTGPFVRNDHQTLQKNLESLKKSKLQKIYESFTEVFTK